MTQHEVDDVSEYNVVWLTPDSDLWNPNDASFVEDEGAFLHSDGTVNMVTDPRPRENGDFLMSQVSKLVATGTNYNESPPGLGEVYDD